jgi:hypothetical protein
VARTTSAEVTRVAPTAVTDAPAVARTVEVYRGLGAWGDRLDYAVAYAGPTPPLTPAAVDQMAAAGVRTLYLQAAALDAKSPDVLVDRWLLAEFVLRAHQRGIAVVGWYLPKWGDDRSDLDRLIAIADFSVLGQRFDGVAVDIEWTQDKLTPTDRSARLVTLSNQLRSHVGAEPLGAIVLPAVVTDVLNKSFWPSFPWASIAKTYDVWLPMSYWSNRSVASGWRDPYVYTTENVKRLRAALGRPDALVHAVGGIGAVEPGGKVAATETLATVGDLDGFAKAVTDTRSIGGSIYDWMTMTPVARDRQRELFVRGTATAPAAPPVRTAN